MTPREKQLEYALRDAAHMLTIAAGELALTMPNTAALLNRAADRASGFLSEPTATAYGRPPYSSGDTHE